MCKFILEEKDICQYCTCAIRSLNRKILRLSKNTKTTFEIINTTLSPRKQSQIKRLQMKYKLVRQKKIRAETLNKKLKNDISYLHDKMSALSSINLEDRLDKNLISVFP
jgi:hypothetical protein